MENVFAYRIYIEHDDNVAYLYAKYAIHSETVFFAADFYLCGADITVKCDSDNVIPAVLLEAEKKIVYELRTSAVFGIYPELSSYEGEKNISATVKIDRADGMATDGYPFRARKQ